MTILTASNRHNQIRLFRFTIGVAVVTAIILVFVAVKPEYQLKYKDRAIPILGGYLALVAFIQSSFFDLRRNIDPGRYLISGLTGPFWDRVQEVYKWVGIAGAAAGLFSLLLQ